VKKLLLFATLSLGALTLAAQEPAEHKSEAKSEQKEDSLMIWKVANFVMLAAGLGYLMRKHLPPFFHSRTTEIQKDITEAQQQKQAADKRAAEVEAKLATLGAEIEKFRTQAKSEMEQEGARIRQETAVQIAKLQKQAEAEIESSGKSASRELSAYAAQLSLDLAEQRIRTRLDGPTEAGLVDDFVKELGSKN
jgi:F0F1-type ATP synthase membrane subunit b/b'